MSEPDPIFLASVDKSWSNYDGNMEGTMFPSRQTKFHRPRSDDCLAVCSRAIVLNDGAVELGGPGSPPRELICRKCVPTTRQ